MNTTPNKEPTAHLISKRTCPRCSQTAVIEDGYCGVCRECTLSPLPTAPLAPPPSAPEMTPTPETDAIFGDQAGLERRRGHGAYALCRSLETRLTAALAKVADLEGRLAVYEKEKWEIGDLNELYYDGGSHLIDFIITYMLEEASRQLGGHGWEAYESDGGLDDGIDYEICTMLRKAGVMDDEDNVPTHQRLQAELASLRTQLKDMTDQLAKVSADNVELRRDRELMLDNTLRCKREFDEAFAAVEEIDWARNHNSGAVSTRQVDAVIDKVGPFLRLLKAYDKKMTAARARHEGRLT